jgi:hypothetical protein
MSQGFVPTMPVAFMKDSSASPSRVFPKAVSTPVSNVDIAASEYFRQQAAERAQRYGVNGSTSRGTFNIEIPAEHTGEAPVAALVVVL